MPDLRCPSQCAYKYPNSKAVWKKTRHVIQTAADPPSEGSSCLAAMGSTRKRRKAARKTTLPKRSRNCVMPAS